MDKALYSDVTFKARDIMAEMQIMYEFLTRGIDREDVEYLRRAYEALLSQDSQGYWLNDTHWVDHPPTDVCYSPPKKKSKRYNNIYEDLQVGVLNPFGNIFLFRNFDHIQVVLLVLNK